MSAQESSPRKTFRPCPESKLRVTPFLLTLRYWNSPLVSECGRSPENGPDLRSGSPSNGLYLDHISPEASQQFSGLCWRNAVAQVQDFYAVHGFGWKKGVCTMGLLFQQGRSRGEGGDFRTVGDYSIAACGQGDSRSHRGVT